MAVAFQKASVLKCINSLSVCLHKMQILVQHHFWIPLFSKLTHQWMYTLSSLSTSHVSSNTQQGVLFVLSCFGLLGPTDFLFFFHIYTVLPFLVILIVSSFQWSCSTSVAVAKDLDTALPLLYWVCMSLVYLNWFPCGSFVKQMVKHCYSLQLKIANKHNWQEWIWFKRICLFFYISRYPSIVWFATVGSPKLFFLFF